jgi:energy-coupling factor transporter ATP-binding protein EcfA2
MAKIKVLQFGPIKEGYSDNDGYIDVQKVTVFIGEQGSGKSSLAKLISTFSWMEKALVRGDRPQWWFERRPRFKKHLLGYHRLSDYVREETVIDYIGDAYRLRFVNDTLSIEKTNPDKYPAPQIMYVPAERNFIANVKNPKALKMTSDSLIEFVTEFDRAKLAVNGGVPLPINGSRVEYDKLNDIVNIIGSDYKVRLTEASSGFQSVVPLYLVSWYLSKTVKATEFRETFESMSSEEIERFRKRVEAIVSDETLTDEQMRTAISVLGSRFRKNAFINIVEEPEQNLFPTSQWEMLKSLMEFNNNNVNNKLVITTHSPYLIAYFSLCIQAESLWNKISDRQDLQQRVEQIVPRSAFLRDEDSFFYQLRNDGTIERIPEYEGIPSDSNYLNESLRDANVEFDKLLEIEQASKG